MQFKKSNTNLGETYRAEDPNNCPICHITIEPVRMFTHFDNESNKLISIWRCTSKDCKKVFGVLHSEEIEKYFKIESYLNKIPQGPIWPEPIKNLKNGKTIGTDKEDQSKFNEAYSQSLEAELTGLDEIAGMGYRKAIEYLVKDWAIQNYPEEKENIQRAWLGAVVDHYYDGDLKDILQRATWLGNDQVHYNRLFEEFDISILKELIGLIVVELDRQYKKNHYINIIQNRKH